jgi:RNA polymerase sigma factor (sigma-70 family)
MPSAGATFGAFANLARYFSKFLSEKMVKEGDRRSMTGATWALLRDLLVERYADFKARLTRQFGSEELANETLHQTWLHLQRQSEIGSAPSLGESDPIRNPPAFLVRVAANIAKDRQRAERRHARHAEIDAALEIADPAAGPFELVRARSDLKIVERAIGELPERTRTILIASRLEGLSHQTIADRLGISRRTVFYELSKAVTYLEAQLENNRSSSCTHETPESS